MVIKTSSARRARPKKPAARKTSAQQPRDTPLLEWIAAGLGLLMIAGVVALLIARGLTANEDARLSARMIGRDGPAITVEVANAGGGAASAVEVEASASGGASEVTIDYVPGRSSRTAVLMLEGDGPVMVRVKGYLVP